LTRLTLPDFTPHDGQRRILQARAKRNVACMGRRYGKTHLMIDVILNQPGGALAGKRGDGRKGLPCAWYAPNDAYFSNVFKTIVQQYLPVIRKATTQPRPVIEFKNGGAIDFWTLENPMKCGRGNFYARVVIDEAAHARHLKDAWEQTIEFTLADLDGDAWFISTPYGMNYFAELWHRGGHKPGWVSHTAPSMDNPHLPPGWMDEKRATMPERVFRQEVLAQFLDTGAGVFRGVDQIPPCDWIDRAADGLAGASYVIGVDWARHNDYTVFIVLRHDGALVHLDRFNGVGYELQVGRLKGLWGRFSGCPILAESNSMGGPLIERLQRDRLNVRAFNTTAQSKADAIESLALAIEQGRLSMPAGPRTEDVRKELVAYDQKRLPSGNMSYGAPPGQHDDTVMALAIAWQGLHHDAGKVSFSNPRPSHQKAGTL
jgi:hypothetical protein